MSRLARSLRWLAVTAGLVVMVAGCALYWLTATESGLRTMLGWAADASEGRLQHGAARGSLRDGFSVEAVRIEDATMRVDLGSVQASIAVGALLRRTVELRALKVEHVLISTHETTVPAGQAESAPTFRIPAWQLPEFSLPLAFSISQLETGRWQFGEQSLIDRISLRGSVSQSGAIRAEALQIDRGPDGLTVVGDYPGGSGLGLSWQAAEGIAAKGKIRATAAELGIELEFTEGGRLDARLDRSAKWSVHAAADETLAKRLVASVPPGSMLRVDLEGERELFKANVMFSADTWPALQATGALALRDDGIAVEKLEVVDDAGGSLAIGGVWSFADAGVLDLTADQVRLWPSDARVESMSGRGRLVVDESGVELNWDGRLRTEQVEPQVHVTATWQNDLIELQRLRLALPDPADECAARLDATPESPPCPSGAGPNIEVHGKVSLGDVVHVDANVRSVAFDPGWVLSGLGGRLDGHAHVEADWQKDQWNVLFEDLTVNGTLNGKALSLTGLLHLDAKRPPTGTIEMQHGAGTASVKANGRALDIDLDQLDLAPLMAGLEGEVTGNVRLPWPWSLQGVWADVQVQGAAWKDWRADAVLVQGGLESKHAPLNIEITELTSEILHPGARIVARVDGQPEALRGQLHLEHESLLVDAAWHGRLGDSASSVELTSLQLDHARLETWTLQQPLRWSATGRGWTLEPACLADGHATLCLQRETPDSALVLRLRDVSMERLGRALGQDTVLRPRGMLTADVALHETAAGWSLRSAAVSAAEGGLVALDEGEPVSVVDWSGLDVSLQPSDHGLHLSLDGALNDGGSAKADLRLAELSQEGMLHAVGSVLLDLPQVAFLGVLTPDLVGAQGRLRAELTRADAVDAEWLGAAQLIDVRGSLPALGLVLGESSLTARRDEGRWMLEGFVDTGEGPLRLEGQWPDGGQAEARLVGERVRLSDTPTLRLLASPDLRLRLVENRLSVEGRVEVPEARLDIERLEAGEPVSDDVVVLDPVAKAERPGPALSAEIELVLGEAVSLRGFGFDGGLQGKLRIRERPGKSAEGRGTLDLRGQYRAYGQDLQIQRGRLVFAGALDNPAIDLRAVRKLRDVQVGINVQGQARAPELRVWSDPVLDDAEAVSYLVLGQPLRSAGGSDDKRLGQAAAALGGNLLASRLGTRLGVDSIGVSDSAALGGAAFTVGKYLSPSLFLSYGVGLFEPGHVVTLRYLLSERADVEVESARESRVGINYRWETD